MKQTILILYVILIFAGGSCKQKTASRAPQPEVKTTPEVQPEKMIVANVYVKPGMDEEFIKSARWIIDSTQKEQGCLEYNLCQDPYKKSDFFFFEKYKDQAAIDFHFGAKYFREFGTKVGELIRQPTEVKIYNISESK